MKEAEQKTVCAHFEYSHVKIINKIYKDFKRSQSDENS